ncbi:BA75_03079T0 [Komagataella pastoris]|uniref:BA75_03079T0 n=1 Tax=Komagataella pastoris TaxID=4922 RepID=A0A1B2JC80_PICPA|nr:BA75_03079T0 [Komagataella pastoris]
MGKASSATKKFLSKHLKRTLKHRKKVQKHTKLVASHKRRGTGELKEDDESKGKIFKDMDVDQFFESGFEIPQEKKGKKSEKVSKAVEEESLESENDSVVEVDSESGENLDEPEDKEEGSDSDVDSQSDNDGLERKDVNKLKSKSTTKSQFETNGEDEDESSEDDNDMEQDLEDLKAEDPEFYKYLAKNDKDLLDFKPVNPLDMIDDDQEEDEYEEDKEESSIPIEEKFHITNTLLKEWEAQLESPTFILLKQLVEAFKDAVRIQDASEEDGSKYVINDPKTFNHLMILAVSKVPLAFQTLLPFKKNHKGVRKLIDSPEFPKVKVLLKAHAPTLVTLLSDTQSVETGALVLSSLQELLPYIILSKSLLKQTITAVVNLWATTNEVDIQITTFAFLNNSAKEFPGDILEITLKAMYSTFVKQSRKTNAHTMPLINFQKNSSIELFGIDPNVGYQVGFEYIRQLAIHLRNSIISKEKEKYKAVYNWQFCHSLDFWSRLLSAQCNPEREQGKESPLRQLIYPLVQVTIGTIKLIPSPQFFPLRFYLIRSLIRVSQHTGVFIPIFPLLSDILNSSVLTRSPKHSSLHAFDFDHNIRANQAYLGTRVYQEGACEQIVTLLGEYFVLYCKQIAFPEVTTPAVIYLRRFTKKSKNVKFNRQLSNLVQKLNQNVEFITKARSNVDFTPKNRGAVNNFLKDTAWESTPLGAYIVVQREIEENRRKILRDSLENKEDTKDQRADGDGDLDLIDLE